MAALAVAVLALTLHTRSLAERAGGLEHELWSMRQAAEAATEGEEGDVAAPQVPAAGSASEPTSGPTPGPRAAELDEYAQLRLELHVTKEQLAAVTALLEQRNAELAQRAEQARERQLRSMQPIPESVRTCLEGLHDCLRQQGFERQRFLGARSLDDAGLHDVEMLEVADNGFGVSFLSAARMTVELDRAAGTLELRFFDGVRSVDGARSALPDDGFALVFRDVDGRPFEQRLPFLVRAEGSYPEQVVARPEPGRLGRDAQRQWLARLDRLLTAARLDKRWRATRVRGMKDYELLQLDLVGTDDKGMVLASAHAGRAVIEVDRTVGIVSLWLRDGVLREGGVESTISGDGFRLLLTGVAPEAAVDAMMGMVVTK